MKDIGLYHPLPVHPSYKWERRFRANNQTQIARQISSALQTYGLTDCSINLELRMGSEVPSDTDTLHHFNSVFRQLRNNKELMQRLTSCVQHAEQSPAQFVVVHLVWMWNSPKFVSGVEGHSTLLAFDSRDPNLKVQWFLDPMLLNHGRITLSDFMAHNQNAILVDGYTNRSIVVNSDYMFSVQGLIEPKDTHLPKQSCPPTGACSSVSVLVVALGLRYGSQNLDRLVFELAGWLMQNVALDDEIPTCNLGTTGKRKRCLLTGQSSMALRLYHWQHSLSEATTKEKRLELLGLWTPVPRHRPCGYILDGSGRRCTKVCADHWTLCREHLPESV